MSTSIDEALAFARDLTSKLRTMASDDPDRAALVDELNDYRKEVRLAADRGRSVAALTIDLEHIDRRLSELDSQRIKAPFAATSFSIQDPEAYSLPINKAIDENNADTIAKLNERQKELKTALEFMIDAQEKDSWA